MKISSRNLAAIMLAISVLCALNADINAQTKSTTTERTINHTNDNWTWHHRDNSIDLQVTIRGKIEFADDYSDVKSITDGSEIRVRDEQNGMVRKFEAQAEGGSITRTYSINGKAATFDADARNWLGKVLDKTVKLGGYDAKARVQKLLKQSGARGVLMEISQLQSDYVKRIYFDELFAQGQLDPDNAREALRLAGTQLSSDYEKAQLLVKMSDRYLTNDEMRGIYIEGVNTINSDYERGRTLSALLKKGELSRDNLMFAIKAAGNIKSDYERAQLLIRISNGFTLDQQAQTAYLDSVASIRSDYEKGRVLSALLKKEPGKATLLFTLKSASTISSDYEKAQLLIKVAHSNTNDETVRNALVDAARTINSEYERGRVLSAVFK